MYAVDPAPDLDVLEEAVEGCLAFPLATRPGQEELGSDLIRLRSLINRLELVFARRTAAFAQTFTLASADDPLDWIRAECHMTVHATHTAYGVGAFEEKLPASVDSFLAGHIGIAHLGLLADTAEFAATRPTPQPFDETRLLRAAERKDVGPFRTACYHVQHALHAASCVASEVDAVEARWLRLRSTGDGTVSLRGWLDAEAGALIRTALEPLARPCGADDHRDREHRLADALVELAGHRLDQGQVPARASQRAHLQVTTTLETLQAVCAAPGAMLDESGPIPDETVQRLACDATITRVLLNAASAVIDVGRSQRVVPPATRRALNVRDQGCRWPGCTRGVSWTGAHHIIHWAGPHFGRTDLDNLALLCRRHHWCVHEGGYQLVRTDEGEILTIAPDSVPDRLQRAERPPGVGAAAA